MPCTLAKRGQPSPSSVDTYLVLELRRVKEGDNRQIKV